MRRAGRADVASFTADLSRFKKLVASRLDEAVENIAFEIAENVTVGGDFSPGSPVDTGFFRSSWQLGINKRPPELLVARPDKVTPSDSLGEMTLQLVGVKAGGVIYLVNNTDYGLELEFGHSGQAPEGMVRVTIAAGQKLADKVVKEMLRP